MLGERHEAAAALPPVSGRVRHDDARWIVATCFALRHVADAELENSLVVRADERPVKAGIEAMLRRAGRVVPTRKLNGSATSHVRSNAACSPRSRVRRVVPIAASRNSEAKPCHKKRADS